MSIYDVSLRRSIARTTIPPPERLQDSYYNRTPPETADWDAVEAFLRQVFEG